MRNGFSLVELSIVLVILGLLVGGIMTGQNLIKAAELRSIGTQFKEYQTATYLFREKYFDMPGDMDTATQFWDPAGSCPPAANDPALSGGTCNGNGDGILADHLGTDQYEAYLFWHHLELAGLVTGQYTGVPGTTVYHAIPGENVPVSKYSNGGWTARFREVAPGDPNYYAINMGNAFVFGAATGTITHGKLLTAEEAWNFDTKFDDGKPGRGTVIARYWDDECADADDNEDLDSDYRLQDTSQQCALTIRNAI